MKLYQIEDQIAEILEGTVDEETGEVTIDYDKLDDLKFEKDRIIEWLIKSYLNLSGDIDKFKAEIDKLSKKKRTLENKQSGLKNYLDILHNETPADYGVHSIKYRASEKLKSGKVDDLPFELTKTETLPVASADIKKYLKSGKLIEGWEIEQRKNIQIK